MEGSLRIPHYPPSGRVERLVTPNEESRISERIKPWPGSHQRVDTHLA
jgi:hypothetical protein